RSWTGEKIPGQSQARGSKEVERGARKISEISRRPERQSGLSPRASREFEVAWAKPGGNCVGESRRSASGKITAKCSRHLSRTSELAAQNEADAGSDFQAIGTSESAARSPEVVRAI